MMQQKNVNKFKTKIKRYAEQKTEHLKKIK